MGHQFISKSCAGSRGLTLGRFSICSIGSSRGTVSVVVSISKEFRGGAAMTAPVTAAMLYDLVACSHRVTMDLFASPSERDEPNPFVALLWERGSLYEQEVIAGLDVPFLDLSTYAGDEKERLTLEAMRRGEPLIYGGRFQAGGLLGDPDLLRKEGTGYVAGDIKSGSGDKGPEDDFRPKLHYAVQLALYTEILEHLGLSTGRRAFVWDVHGREVPYDFQATYGKRDPRTLWQDYQEVLQAAQAIVSRHEETLPAYSAACKLCHWYSACVKRLKENDDLTIIPELGRSKRDVMYGTVRTVTALAKADPAAFINGKKTAFPGIGPDTLRKFGDRARLLAEKDAKPFLRVPVNLPDFERELYFDIEVDPMRDICYLHGFVERYGGDNATESVMFAFAGRADRGSGESRVRASLGLPGSAAALRDLLLLKIRTHDLQEAARKVPRNLQRRRDRGPLRSGPCD